MRIERDEDRCALSALCTAMAPDVFLVNDDAQLDVSQHCDESQRASVEQAAAACPTQAIRLVD